MDERTVEKDAATRQAEALEALVELVRKVVETWLAEHDRLRR